MKQPCWKCNGTGIVQNEGSTSYEIVCPICGGTGHLDDMVYNITVGDISLECGYCGAHYSPTEEHDCLRGIVARVERLERKLLEMTVKGE